MINLNSLNSDQLLAAAGVLLNVVEHMRGENRVSADDILNKVRANQAFRRIDNMQAFHLSLGEKLETIIGKRESGSFGLFCGEFYTCLPGQCGRLPLIDEAWAGDGATIYTCMVEGVPYRIARLCGQHPRELWGYVENAKTGNRILLEDEWTLAGLKEI